MKKLIVALLLLTITMIHANDELWFRAKEIAENPSHLIPTRSIYETKLGGSENLLKMAGLSATDVTITVSHTMTEDGTIENAIVSAVNNLATPGSRSSRMVDEELIEAAKSIDVAAIADSIPIGSMFTESDNKKITVRRLRETKNIDGHSCVAYDVRYSESGKRADQIRVKMWIDTTTAALITVETKPLGQSAGEDFTIYFHNIYNEQTNSLQLYKFRLVGKKVYMNMIVDIESVTTFEDFVEKG